MPQLLCRDRYGRALGVCFQGDIDLNDWMVRQGYALAYRRYSTAYVEAENEARTVRRGLWLSEFTAPWIWREHHRERRKR